MSLVELEAASLTAEDGLLRMPFDSFRFCCEAENGTQLLGVVCRRRKIIDILAFHRTKGEGISSTFYAVSFSRPSPDKFQHIGKIFDSDTLTDISSDMKADGARESNAAFKEEFFARDRSSARQSISILTQRLKLNERRVAQMRGMIAAMEHGISRVIPSAFSDALPVPKDIFVAYYHVIALLCYEYLAPHNFFARVTPDVPGKSVEWKAAREHYTLIHRNHPANSASVLDGDTIEDDKNKNVARIAHSRRAHTRLLRSDRFRYARGKRVFVRATWCGPKEWKDTAGQTYQILTPVVQ